jgi:hypothetical protein
MSNNHDKAHTSISEKIAIKLQSISTACSIAVIIIIALINMLTTMCYISPYSVRYPYFDTMAALIGIIIACIMLYLLSHASSIIERYRLRNVAIACILITGLLSLIWISMNMFIDEGDSSEIIAYAREIFHGNANNVYSKPNAYMQRYPYQSGVVLIILPIIAMSMNTSADNAYIILEYANIPLMMILVALIILIAYKIKNSTAGKYAGIISTMFAPLWMGAMQVYGNIYSLPLIFTLILLIIIYDKQTITKNTSTASTITNASTINTTANTDSTHNTMIENASTVSTIVNNASIASTNTNRLIKNPTSTTTSKGKSKSTTRMLILIAISIILVSFILGMIKLNNLIIGIASMITLLLITLTAWHTNRMKSIISIILAVIIIPMMFAGGTTAKFTVEKLSGVEFDKSKAQPMSLFIGMGLSSESDHGNGFYLRKIGSPLAYDLKTENAKSDETIANRLNQMRTDPVGAMGFFGLKILQTWGDPTYSYGNRLGKTMFNSEADKTLIYNKPMHPLNENPSQKIINSNAFMIAMRTYCDGIGIIMTILAVIGAISCSKKRNNHAFMLPALIVLGGFLFHIIWETQPEYAYTYALMLLPYAGIGGSACCEWLHGMHGKSSYSELNSKLAGFIKRYIRINKHKSDKEHANINAITATSLSDVGNDTAIHASNISHNATISTCIITPVVSM